MLVGNEALKARGERNISWLLNLGYTLNGSRAAGAAAGEPFVAAIPFSFSCLRASKSILGKPQGSYGLRVKMLQMNCLGSENPQEEKYRSLIINELC
jgi:hypothetical protein